MKMRLLVEKLYSIPYPPQPGYKSMNKWKQFINVINTEAWSSGMGVGRGAKNPTL